MSTGGELLQGLLDEWEDEPCPFCGHPAEPWYSASVPAFTFRCSWCDQVIEAFELYVDWDGEPFTDHHVRWVPDDGVVGKPFKVYVVAT